jgi:glycosyltransferase involved in cell wall biosynthesis
MSDVSIIIPTRNEEHNLPLILPYLPHSAEIIVVDGHSNDNTVKIARGLRPDAVILHQQGHGKGNALKMGFHHVSREFIITFDADGSFQPTEVYKLIQKLREGYDLVKGSRFLPGGGTLDMPLNRIVGNWVLTATANVLYGSHYSDLVYGFHAFHRDALKKLMLHSDGFEMDAELYLRASRAKLKIAELPSFENKRVYGKSNLNSIRDGSRILKTIIRERFRD